MTAIKKKRSLDRLDWLEAALEVLADEGVERVKVELLAKKLAVTKGSFYWHFRTRDQLLLEALQYWEEQQEKYISQLRYAEVASPEERLWSVLRFIAGKDYRHDLAVRAWAPLFSPAAAALRRLDRERTAFVAEIFLEMGFDDLDAQLRSRLVYFYQVAEQTITFRDSTELKEQLDRRRFMLLTGKKPPEPREK